MAFGRLESRKPDAPMSEINVTPMVDVMLVLLVIFILTAPLMTSAIRLDLPQSEGGEAGASPQVLSLVVDAQSNLYLNDKPITPDALRLRLAESAKRNPHTELELRADQSVPYGRVVEAMGLAQKAGLSRIGFVAQTTPALTR
ncbi:biopolymer transporter ExbD [Limnohabitans sp. 15K]|uniref:ExbD/TolR family protein n=1 Tax=Limnohabitans sp. 15K TaxID=1100706 RepID=UPI000C1EBBB9|nr:biopolymer transporter ExbD [Limnohabitans sp. 15K]PIT83265.1 biopolymer transporter ExbD [Limnohabitans sp. 15K]